MVERWLIRRSGEKGSSQSPEKKGESHGRKLNKERGKMSNTGR